MANDWLTLVKNAKKSSIVQNNLKKVHFAFSDGRELVEEYNTDTCVVTRRAWKVKTDIGSEGRWDIEVGEPEPTFIGDDGQFIRENPSQPVVSRRITKRSLEWRIRNLPYPVETYTVTAEAENKCITVRTTNKKYFKRILLPDLERVGLTPIQENINFMHKFNTLIINYKKPIEVMKMEEAIWEEVKNVEPQSVSDVNSYLSAMKNKVTPCRPYEVESYKYKFAEGSMSRPWWLDYSNMGRQIPGTRFIAFKVPLKQDICNRRLPQSEWFTPADLLESAPELKLVVNLTNTDDGRYYNVVDFEKKGIKILPLKCVGRGTLPPEHMVEKFCSEVDDFMCTNPMESDDKSLIGVHCTHGLNRTGYFICRYMVDRMGITPEKAIELFEAARGHPIERNQYLNQIRGVATTSIQDTTVPETIKYPSRTNYTSPMDNLYGDGVSSHPYRRNAGPYKREYESRRQHGTRTSNYGQYKNYDNYSYHCQSSSSYNPNYARSNHRSRSFMRRREPLPENWRMREDKTTF